MGNHVNRNGFTLYFLFLENSFYFFFFFCYTGQELQDNVE